jgi:hypothetical protein
MRVMSNAFFDQAEIVQLDRRDHGPLELVFLDGVLDREGQRGDEAIGHIAEWNRRFRNGLLRKADNLEWVQGMLPALRGRSNPNIFLVPRIKGYTELHSMLASIVPEGILRRHGIWKRNAFFSLIPFLHGFCEELDKPELFERISWKESNARKVEAARAYASGACRAFEEYIWTKLARHHRWHYEFFDPTSPLRLLAGDVRFWMNRLYRLAVEWSEDFEEVSGEGENWESIEALTHKLRENLPQEQWSNFLGRRPLMGGSLWNPDDPEDCEAVVEEMLNGAGIMESLQAVLEVLHTHPVHEDFSDRYSWIKEDFERSFYRKRAKVKVTLLETVDDLPVWSAKEPVGYGDILFRDLLSFFDRRDQHIFIAVRQGKTVSEIATELGHKGHAAVSRRLAEIKRKLRRLLERDR